MPYRYCPTSSLVLQHNVDNKLYFNRGIDTPLLDTVRNCTITIADKTTYNADTYKREFTNAVCSENCVIKKSTLLYYDTIHEVYIWKYEEQSLITNIPTAMYNTVWQYNQLYLGYNSPVVDYVSNNSEPYNVYWCIGITPGIWKKTDNVDAYMATTGLQSIVTNAVINCSETIFAKIPSEPAKITLVPEHQYTKNAFGNRAVGSVYNTMANTSASDWNSKTALLDGGPDLFYPEWCRNMTSDFLWRKAANDRAKEFGKGMFADPNYAYVVPNYKTETSDWVAENPISQEKQQIGAIAFRSQEDFIASLIFTLHDSNGIVNHEHVVNLSSIGSVLDLIKTTNPNVTSYYPLGII